MFVRTSHVVFGNNTVAIPLFALVKIGYEFAFADMEDEMVETIEAAFNSL